MTETGQSTMNLAIDLEIDASPLRVFNAITNGVANWWGRDYFESAEDAVDIHLEPRLGGKFFERWSLDTKSPDGALLGTVVALKHAKLLRLRGTFGMGDTLIQGLVEYELFASGQGTKLKFNHQAFGQISDDTKERYSTSWNVLLSSLKLYLEHGEATGIRHEPHISHNFD
ncbi:MAG: SRPBCC domain-containing protein [Candidatus Obscuribacterales bacterium]|nr:SRPBCC domain-containing protein [Candidatus Obscuribacterales bacterium]